MSYLNSSVPSDSEAVNLGASRMRALASSLNTLISQVWADTGAFLTGWITQPMLGANIVAATNLAAESVTSAAIAANAVGLSKMATQTAGAIAIYDGSGNAAVLAPGTSGQLLTSAGAGLPPAYADATQAHGIPTFITPVVLATIGSGTVAWTTISGLESYGVPLTASALILSVKGNFFCDNSSYVYAEVDVRASASGPVIPIFGMGSTGNSTQILATQQSVAPCEASGTTLQFDYQSPDVFHDGGATISLIGWIT